MITPQQMTRETRQLPDGSMEVRVGLRLQEVATVPWADVRAHDVGHVVTTHPALLAIRAAEDRLMEQLYGPAPHLWDVAAGLTAVLHSVRQQFLPRYNASEQVTGGGLVRAERVPPQWPLEYKTFRALLLQSALALGLRWSAAGDKFVPQTGGEEGAV